MTLPPAIQLILSENLLEIDAPTALRRRLERGLWKAIHEQGQWAADNWEYEDRPGRAADGGFRVTLAASLNPFSSGGKCNGIACRVTYAQEFVRSLALYCDRLVVPDHLTSLFANTERLTYDFAETLFVELAVLRVVLPLVDADLIRFAAPVHHYCANCAAQRDATLDQTISVLTRLVIEAGIEARIQDSGTNGTVFLILACPDLFRADDHPLVTQFRIASRDSRPLLAKIRRLKGGRVPRSQVHLFHEYIQRFVTAEARHALFELGVAQHSGSVLAAGSRLETQALRTFGHTPSSRVDIESWEAVRAVDLPYVRDLTPEEVLILKAEAGPALSTLRDSLARRLADSSDKSEAEISSIVRELREQASFIEGKLRALRTAGSRTERVLARAAFTFVLYGLVSDASVAAIAVGAALQALATAHAPAKIAETEAGKVSTQPAYVLVKAKELLRHRSQSTPRG